MLYELLCGVVPFAGRWRPTCCGRFATTRRGCRSRVEPRACRSRCRRSRSRRWRRRPSDRYASAHEMALDLTRYLEGRPVLARPTQYASDARLTRARRTSIRSASGCGSSSSIRTKPTGCAAVYRQFDVREDDWIAASRMLVVLADRPLPRRLPSARRRPLLLRRAPRLRRRAGVTRPLLVLGVPFVGLNLAARHLYRTDRRAVAVAFFLAASACCRSGS